MFHSQHFTTIHFGGPIDGHLHFGTLMTPRALKIH